MIFFRLNDGLSKAYFFCCFLVFVSHFDQSHANEPLLTGTYLEESGAFIETKPSWDRSNKSFEVDFGYRIFVEKNSFESDGFFFGLNYLAAGFYVPRLEIRTVEVRETDATQTLSQTPFRQSAQDARYELALGGLVTLAEGSMQSLIAPSVLNNVMGFHAMALLQYNHFKTDKGLAGQEQVRHTYVQNLGFRWAIYFPERLSLSADILYHSTVLWQNSNKDLPSWLSYSLSTSYRF